MTDHLAPFGPGFWDAYELRHYFEKPNLPFNGEIPPNLWEFAFVEACLNRLELSSLWWNTIPILENANRIDNNSVNCGLLFSLEKETKWNCRLSPELLEAIGEGFESLHLQKKIPDKECKVNVELYFRDRKLILFVGAFLRECGL